MLDDVEPELLLEGIHKCILYFQKTNYWKKFKFSDGRYLVLIDATETHRSQKVHCKDCLTYRHKDGRVEYAHKALVATLVHPDLPFVLPLCCEEIRNGDGNTKQDCEFNALKNHGYHLEHNYGHGKRNLAFNMIILNIIACLLHQLLNMIERLFAMAIDYSGTKKMFYGSLKFGIQHILWPDWRYFLEYLAGKKEPIRPI